MKYYHDGEIINRKGFFNERKLVSVYMEASAAEDLEDYCETMETSKSSFMRYLFDEYRTAHPIAYFDGDEYIEANKCMNKMTLYLSKEQSRDLDEYARLTGMSKSSFLVNILNEFRSKNPVEYFDEDQMRLF